jgi:hypothetical protein
LGKSKITAAVHMDRCGFRDRPMVFPPVRAAM